MTFVINLDEEGASLVDVLAPAVVGNAPRVFDLDIGREVSCAFDVKDKPKFFQSRFVVKMGIVICGWRWWWREWGEDR